MKYLAVIILCLLCLGATFRSGWSYSGQIRFKLNEDVEAILYHIPDSPHPYGPIAPDDEKPFHTQKLDKGVYLLTVEGYYYLDLK
jgi:hypothetical protein